METQLEISQELFEKLLKAKDDFNEQMEAKEEMQEAIEVDDVYNGMMTLLNILIGAKPELQNIVNNYYEDNSEETA